MKMVMAVLFVVVSAIGADVGRYQLLSANVSNGIGEMEPVLFRIDTTTGETWRFERNMFPVKTNDAGKAFVMSESWVKIPESISATNILDAISKMQPTNAPQKAIEKPRPEGLKL